MRRIIWQLGPIVGLALSITLFDAAISSAQTWNGGGADDLWSDGTNWQGGTPPANGPAGAATADVHFAGTTRLTPDVDTPWEIRTLTFDPLAGAFVLHDQQLTVDGNGGVGITNNSGVTQTINNAVVLLNAQTINAASGDIVFGSTLNSGTGLLTVAGGGDVTISGQMTGTGGLTKNGSGTLILNSGLNSTTFTGPVTVNAGTLQAGADNSLSTGAYTITGGTLNLNGTDENFASINQSGGSVTLGASSSTLGVTGAFTQSGGTMDLAGGTGNFTTFTQTNSGSSFSTTGGTANFSGAVSLTDGAFNVNSGAANFNAGLTQNGASTFTNNAGGATTVTGNYTMNGGTSTTSGGATTNVSGTLQLNGTSIFNVSDGTTGGTATVGAFSGVSGTTLNLGTGGTFNDNNASDQTFAGDITSTNGTFVLGNGTNTHTLTLTGDNQTGFTGGTIDITANSTLQAGTTPAANATALSTANYIVDGTLNSNGNNFTTTGLTGAATGNVSLGTGTMTIQDTGASVYSGSVTGATGSAIVMDTTAAGGSQTIGGAITNVANISTTAENVGTLTLSGNITGPSTAVTANGGTIVLGGTNTLAGGTTLNTGGTVSISSDANIGGPSSAITFHGGTLEVTGTALTSLTTTHAINNSTFSGTFDIDNAANTFTVSQNLSGTGSLGKTGAGTLLLTGTNTYSGGTTVTNGTLEGTTSNIQGDISTTTPGIVDFNQTTNGTYAGVISGSGNVVKDGTGTVIFTGNNTYTGTTTISAGTLQIGGTATTAGTTGSLGTGNVVDDAALIFNRSDDITVGNNISTSNPGTTSGTLTKDGAGLLTLSGTNTYGGATTVNAGRLDITSSTTTSSVTVVAEQTGSPTITGGTLGGNGTINGAIINNGTVSPGTAGAPLSVLNQTAGNYTGNSGSTFVVNVNSTEAPNLGVTNSGLSTTGSATLDGGSKVLVNITGTNFVNGGVYTAIAGGSAATVSPDATISTNEFFVRATDLMASGDDVVFTLTTNFVPTTGATFNQIQAGRYLNANSTNTNPDFVLVQNALTSITNPAEARAALTQITGDIHPTMAQVNVNNTQIVIDQVATRLRGGNFAPCGPLAVAQDGTPLGAPIAFVGCDENGMPEFEGGEQCAQPQWSAWGIGFGMGGSTEFSGNATSASFGMGGVVAGMEHWEDDSHLLGLYGAYVGSGVDTPNGQSATMNGGQFGGYMFGDDGFNYYTVLGGFEFDGDTTTRRLGFGTGTDALTDINNSSYSDWQAFAYAERGMSFQSGQRVIQPFVGLQYIFVRQDAFTETGGTNTALDLSGSADSTNSLRSMLGARMQWAFTNHACRRTLPEIHAMWVHEFLDTSSGLSETMVPIGGTPFIVQGIDSGRDWAVVGGNFTWEMVNNWSMFVNYDLQTNAFTTYHVGSGGLGYRW